MPKKRKGLADSNPTHSKPIIINSYCVDAITN